MPSIDLLRKYHFKIHYILIVHLSKSGSQHLKMKLKEQYLVVGRKRQTNEKYRKLFKRQRTKFMFVEGRMTKLDIQGGKDIKHSMDFFPSVL